MLFLSTGCRDDGGSISNVSSDSATDSAKGVLDTSFNSTGFVVASNTAGGNGDEKCAEIVIDTTGRIIVTGKSYIRLVESL